jgi:hypothetical protein
MPQLEVKADFAGRWECEVASFTGGKRTEFVADTDEELVLRLTAALRLARGLAHEAPVVRESREIPEPPALPVQEPLRKPWRTRAETAALRRDGGYPDKVPDNEAPPRMVEAPRRDLVGSGRRR